MKLASMMLFAAAMFAGDDWKKIPKHTPGTPTPEPETYMMAVAGLTIIAGARWLKK